MNHELSPSSRRRFQRQTPTALSGVGRGFAEGAAPAAGTSGLGATTLGQVDAAIRLRPVEGADLVPLARFSTEPEALGELEWTGFRDPRCFRRRWEEDGLLGEDCAVLAVVLVDADFAGYVSWSAVPAVPARAAPGRGSPPLRLEIGVALLPEHRGRGYGTAAQKLLVDYLFATTAVHRIQATTGTANVAEQRALEKVGFRREGVMREVDYRAGRWVDAVMYSLLRDDKRPPEGAG